MPAYPVAIFYGKAGSLALGNLDGFEVGAQGADVLGQVVTLFLGDGDHPEVVHPHDLHGVEIQDRVESGDLVRVGVLLGITHVEQVVGGGAQDPACILVGVAVVARGPRVDANAVQIGLGNTAPLERGPEAGIRLDGVLCSEKLLKDDARLPRAFSYALPGGHTTLGQVDDGLVGATLPRRLVKQDEEGFARHLVTRPKGVRDLRRWLVQAHRDEAEVLRARPCSPHERYCRLDLLRS